MQADAKKVMLQQNVCNNDFSPHRQLMKGVFALSAVLIDDTLHTASSVTGIGWYCLVLRMTCLDQHTYLEVYSLLNRHPMRLIQKVSCNAHYYSCHGVEYIL